MRLHRLPIAVAPAQQETVASYLTRLANLHGLPLRELWEPISVPRPRSRRTSSGPAGGRNRPPNASTSSARCPSCIPPRTGRRCAMSPDRLPTLRRTTPRRPGDPPTAAPPLRRTCHRYWIGPPDIDQPATGLGGLDDIVGAQRHHLRLLRRHGPAAAYDAVLTGFLFCGHLWAERRTRRRRCSPRLDPPRRGPHPGGHRDGDVQRLPAVRGGLSRSRQAGRPDRLAHLATPCGW